MFTNILVGTDGSDTAGVAVQKAIELAKASEATLHVVSAYRPVTAGQAAALASGMPVDASWQAARRAEIENMVNEAVIKARVELPDVRAHVLPGDPGEVLIDLAENEAIDLIIVGNRGMAGVKRFVLGSVPNRVAHHAPCSVLIVHTT